MLIVLFTSKPYHGFSYNQYLFTPKWWILSCLKLSLPRTGIKTAPHVLSFGFFKLWMAQKSLSVHDSANISRTGLSSVKVEDTIEYFRGVHDQVKHETTDRNAKYKAFIAGGSLLKSEIWYELCLHLNPCFVADLSF